jgi:hypothetical protein
MDGRTQGMPTETIGSVNDEVRIGGAAGRVGGSGEGSFTEVVLEQMEIPVPAFPALDCSE